MTSTPCHPRPERCHVRERGPISSAGVAWLGAARLGQLSRYEKVV